jgi:peptidoglycan/LPS O-acetylase OafA/YrhL
VNFANIKHPLNTRIANLFFILIPSFHFIPIIVKSPQFLLNAGPAFYLYLVCIAFMFNHKLISTISEQFIKLTQYTGSISYGLYIFHFPILCYFSHVKIYPGTTLGLSIKFVLYMTALFIFSHIAERIIQPRIKSYFLSKF